MIPLSAQLVDEEGCKRAAPIPLERAIDLFEAAVTIVTRAPSRKTIHVDDRESLQAFRDFSLELKALWWETGDNFVEDHDFGGSRYHGVARAETNVRIIAATGGQITCPELSSAGIRAVMLILGDGRQEEPFFPQYRVRSRTFYSPGRVFSVLWDEKINQDSKRVTALERSTRPVADRSSGSAPKHFISLKRYFVVIREGTHYCTALPIMSYGGEGVSAKGCIKNDHAIAFIGPVPPTLRADEHPSPGESPMRRLSIRIVTDEHEELSPTSRIDFGTVYTIHHNVRIKPFGRLHNDSIEPFNQQFISVWASKSQNSEEGGIGHYRTSDDTTLAATRTAQKKGKQAQRPSSSQHVAIPESAISLNYSLRPSRIIDNVAAEAATSHGNNKPLRNESLTFQQLPVGFFSNTQEKRAWEDQTTPPESCFSEESNAAAKQTSALGKISYLKEARADVMVLTSHCMRSFNILSRDARPPVLETQLVTGLRSIDEWRDERARFKLAMNDLNNVLCTDDFLFDQDALRVARGVLEDIEELTSNLGEVVLRGREQTPYQETARQQQECIQGVPEGAREEPDELAVRLQSTADMIDDLFRSTKLLRRCLNRNTNTAQPVEAAGITSSSPRAEPSSPTLLRRYENRNANTAQPVEAAEITFLSPRAEPSSPTPDVHSENNWQESPWTLDDSETEGSSDDDVESYAEE